VIALGAELGGGIDRQAAAQAELFAGEIQGVEGGFSTTIKSRWGSTRALIAQITWRGSRMLIALSTTTTNLVYVN